MASPRSFLGSKGTLYGLQPPLAAACSFFWLRMSRTWLADPRVRALIFSDPEELNMACAHNLTGPLRGSRAHFL